MNPSCHTHRSLGWPSRIARTCAVWIGLGLWSVSNAQTATPAADLGRRIYEQGQRLDGQPWRGDGVGGLRTDATCASCHRRSGMGGPEGNRRVPAIAAPDLFASPGDRPAQGPGDLRTRGERLGKQVVATRRESRDAYTDATLARAIRSGIDASGRPLSPLMPRYGDLDDATMGALIAHLRSLQAAPPPGRVDGVLHLATVITPDAPPARVRALTGVLERWAARRAEVRLHTWTLDGPPEQWPAQLTARQQAEPVWAVLSGAGGSDWRAVQAFCEAQALPCVLPLVDTLPPGAAESHWSLHFSPGIELEARALAQHLAADAPPAVSRGGGRIVHWTQGGLSAQAATAFASGWQALHATDASPVASAVLRIRVLRIDDPADLAAAWSDVGAKDTLVLWLDPAALQAVWQALPANPHAIGLRQIVLSSRLAGHDAVPPVALRGVPTLRVGDELDPRGLQGRTALGLLPWARQVGLEVDDEREQARAYAAVGYFGDAVARLRGRLDREFLLETLERAVDTRPYAGPYAALSLGPGQRVASKSVQLWQLVEAEGEPNRRDWRLRTERITP